MTEFSLGNGTQSLLHLIFLPQVKIWQHLLPSFKPSPFPYSESALISNWKHSVKIISILEFRSDIKIIQHSYYPGQLLVAHWFWCLKKCEEIFWTDLEFLSICLAGIIKNCPSLLNWVKSLLFWWQYIFFWRSVYKSLGENVEWELNGSWLLQIPNWTISVRIYIHFLTLGLIPGCLFKKKKNDNKFFVLQWQFT